MRGLDRQVLLGREAQYAGRQREQAQVAARTHQPSTTVASRGYPAMLELTGFTSDGAPVVKAAIASSPAATRRPPCPSWRNTAQATRPGTSR